MIRLICRDYNLVRAVCIRLGSSAEPTVQERLIEMVGSVSPVVAYNARYALRFSRDPEIRAVLERYEDSQEVEEPAPPADRPPACRSKRIAGLCAQKERAEAGGRRGETPQPDKPPAVREFLFSCGCPW